MSMNVSDYSQFYKGTEKINQYGSASSGSKDTLVKYEFNTTDENGNKVMDQMSREETIQAMKDISSMYTDIYQNRRYIYAGSLEELRKKEKNVAKCNMENLDAYLQGKVTLNEVYDKYVEQRKGNTGDNGTCGYQDHNEHLCRVFTREGACNMEQDGS